MVVHIDPSQHNLKKKQNGRQKTKWPAKVIFSITQSIYKLESSDFFIVVHNDPPQQNLKKKKWLPKIKLSITQSIF